jgi:hypothetical protein
MLAWGSHLSLKRVLIGAPFPWLGSLASPAPLATVSMVHAVSQPIWPLTRKGGRSPQDAGTPVPFPDLLRNQSMVHKCPVVLTCSLSYSGDRDWEKQGLKPAQTKN